MARLYTFGAEIGMSSAAGRADGNAGGAGGATIETSIVRTGAGSYKCDSGAGNISAQVNSDLYNLVGSRTYYMRGYFYATANPSTASKILMHNQLANAPVARMNTSGQVELVVNSVVQGSASIAITDSSWHRVELSITTDATPSNYTAAELRVDGSTVATWSGTQALESVSSNFTFGWEGAPGANKIIYIDDVAMNDSTGAAQNSWCGDGKIVLLKPISDNARGTGWVNDANAASGFFNATDNTPPVGIADTTGSTGLHQIRNGTANANSSVDLNMTTYTNAGIAAADTINCLIPWVATGAPVTTSAKAGTVGVSSNPVIANVSLSATGTSGAFWAGTAAGTFPTGWKWSAGTTTYSPSVTLGNSPVMRITQVTSSTRIAMVCAMFIYVDYTPAASYVPRSPGIDSGFGLL